MEYFEDFTYRGDHWAPGDYSEWKIEGGRFWFKHRNYDKFEVNGSGNNADYHRQQEKYLLKDLEDALTKILEDNLLK